MADTKITGLTENTAPISTDILPMVDDPGGTAATQKVTLSNIINMISNCNLTNEIMNFPAPLIDVDLVATNQWWDTIGTPSTAATMVDVAGEAGITESYEYAIKFVADGATEGFYQRYTYADQLRVKSGRTLSAIAAVWVGTAGKTVTMSLTTSASTAVSATATAQAWTICRCENLTLDGTYVDLKFSVDGADTVYVVPLGVNVGAKAFRLPIRPMRLIDDSDTLVVNNADPGGSTGVDVDVTANTSNICCMVSLACSYFNTSVALRHLYVRRKGTTNWRLAAFPIATTTNFYATTRIDCPVDDGQSFQYKTDALAAEGESVYIYVQGYWEWA